MQLHAKAMCRDRMCRMARVRLSVTIPGQTWNPSVPHQVRDQGTFRGTPPLNGRRPEDLRGVDDFRRRVWYGRSLPSMTQDFKRLPSSERRALYQRIIARCARKPGERPAVVVFDLDGTLMDNRPRTTVILRELAAELKAEAHSSAEILAAARSEELAYLLGDSLKRLGVEHPDLIARAEAFWRERFFSDGYLRHDIAVPGS